MKYFGKELLNSKVEGKSVKTSGENVESFQVFLSTIISTILSTFFLFLYMSIEQANYHNITKL